MCVHSVFGAKRIARQYWRAWIETFGPGLAGTGSRRIARQYWRAWIETQKPSAAGRHGAASPASIGGRGLKHQRVVQQVVVQRHRPPVLAGVD